MFLLFSGVTLGSPQAGAAIIFYNTRPSGGHGMLENKSLESANKWA